MAQLRGRIEDVVKNKVNHAQVQRFAEEDSRIARRALEAFANEISLVSVDPVIVFDHARISTGASMPNALIRNAAGGGLRPTFASILSFEAGYAFTLNRSPHESRGSFFFGLRFHDLIR